MEWRDHKPQDKFSIFHSKSPRSELLIPKKAPGSLIEAIKKMFSVPESGLKMHAQAQDFKKNNV
jgi:hypothetical protein